MPKAKKPETENSLAAWSRAIQEDGARDRERELKRQERAQQFFDETSRFDLTWKAFVHTLLREHDEGRITTVELLTEFRDAATSRGVMPSKRWSRLK